MHYIELPQKRDYYRLTSRTAWRAMIHSHLTNEEKKKLSEITRAIVAPGKLL